MSDLISRQAAIYAIVNTVSEIGLHDNSEAARYGATFRHLEILDIIEGMPSAQPERKTGKWKPKMLRAIDGTLIQEQKRWYGYVYVCDQCGFEMLGTENFCPGCGLPMEVET